MERGEDGVGWGWGGFPLIKGKDLRTSYQPEELLQSTPRDVSTPDFAGCPAPGPRP